jgi:hypothetical protein
VFLNAARSAPEKPPRRNDALVCDATRHSYQRGHTIGFARCAVARRASPRSDNRPKHRALRSLAVAHRHSSNADRRHHVGAGFSLRPPHGAALAPSKWPPLAIGPDSMCNKCINAKAFRLFYGCAKRPGPCGQMQDCRRRCAATNLRPEMAPKSVSGQSLGALAGWLSDDQPPGFPEHKDS